MKYLIGTGKTYVGAMAVNLLLKNEKFWSYKKQRPILITCQTNHALVNDF
jgi:hypothetical protein